MKLWYQIITLYLLITLARSEEQEENDNAKPAGICNVAECSKLFNPRLEAMEMAVKKIVLAILSQTSDVFAPIKEILEEDPTFSSILPLNSTIYSSSRKAPSVNNGGHKQDKNIAVDNLKRAVKCSLAHLVDINSTDPDPRGEPLPQIAAEFTNDTLKIKLPIPSAECVKVSLGVRIRIYESADGYKVPLEAPIFVPQKCLQKISKTWYSIDFRSPSSSAGKGNACAFSLTKSLTQCRSYILEVVRNYQSLAGKAMQTELVIPPKLKGKAHLKPLISASAHSSSLTLNWEDNSGCAPQLTSLSLELFKDGIADIEGKANATVVIPRSCFKQPKGEENLFSLALATNELTCPIGWKPLDACRKYSVDMTPQYSATWNGLSSSFEIFTEQEGDFSTVTDSVFLICPRKHYLCYGGCMHITEYVCNNDVDCDSEIDERYCEQDDCHYYGGFQCGRQCIPKELVCNGKYDCLDGSDEGPDCGNTCKQLTNPSGNFSSQKFHMPSYEIHPDKIFDTVRNTKVLISVQPTHHIWLTFNRFNTFQGEHIVKVYDGPYSTSPLLLSHSGSTKPKSVRSSSNNLYVEFPSYYDQSYGVDIFYASVFDKEHPFTSGCGGYIHGDGIISSSSSLTSPVSDCIWFVEAAHHDGIIVLKEKFDNKRNTSINKFATLDKNLIMKVYDGWNTSGRVLWDDKGLSTQPSRVIYSVNKKMMVRMNWPEQGAHQNTFNWHVNTIKLITTIIDGLAATSGTIKSPNYPASYPNLVDFRWNIVTAPHTKISLLFALLETQEGFDFLYVYDGPTVNSLLLLEKSGSASLPFTVNSSTNQMLVRLTSDDETTSTGFLAIYSTV
ncbi:uncharacterized protein LOC130690021 [Daphnia carinata]|uniref:uncharacterized protein LOC130690021 n=1 Tax=Daphnia carinata TaxID=120202 RepID=UPI002869154A|nr:uncharacterized protein LOC130690021 [Daphnia carinata]